MFKKLIVIICFATVANLFSEESAANKKSYPLPIVAKFNSRFLSKNFCIDHNYGVFGKMISLRKEPTKYPDKQSDIAVNGISVGYAVNGESKMKMIPGIQFYYGSLEAGRNYFREMKKSNDLIIAGPQLNLKYSIVNHFNILAGASYNLFYNVDNYYNPNPADNSGVTFNIGISIGS